MQIYTYFYFNSLPDLLKFYKNFIVKIEQYGVMFKYFQKNFVN